tara:strand:- start:2549 stop:2752 length:204 start_codon:yes stop_codon:yes gene_type:complete
MSSVFGSKPKKTASDIWAEQQLKKEKEAQAQLEKDEAAWKLKFGKGLVGPRSMFTKAGGAGFYDPED